MGDKSRRGIPSGSVLPCSQARLEPVQKIDGKGNASWRQVLATTVRLWLSRRMPRVSIEWPDMSASSATADHPVFVPVLSTTSNPNWGRVLVTTVRLWLARRMPRISIEWRVSFGRLLAASMLGLGLLGVGVGTAGVAVAGVSAGPAVRWPARPVPIPAPPVRTVLPVWLPTVQRAAPPVLLTIPAIGVRTKLVDLGLNANGSLQVPVSTAVAGWYRGSPPPGAVGAAVIAGHVDSRSGLGVFFWLRNLRPGDRVYIGRSDGSMVVFTVTSVQTYAKDQFPTASVYGSVPDAELRLITCGGTFDRTLGSYLSNVVVFARLTG